jgi:hypothetical protein
MAEANELLTKFKKSIGDLSGDTALDDYYTNCLTQAQAMLTSEDISATVLETDVGEFATILCAELIMTQKNLADNSTLTLLRNILTAKTKAERCNDDG